MEPRRDRMNPKEMETHHLWSRCVRSMFLMGDSRDGVDRGERRYWLESLIEYQASVFAVDVAAYNIVSNHFHEVVRNRPDVAAAWSDDEVAWRWKMAWPEFRDGQWRCVPTDESIERLLQREVLENGHIQKLRENLANISWLQARIKQPLALYSNRRDGIRGHMWEQRYGNRRLDTEEEAVTALLYNDLQQRRAGLCEVDLSQAASIQRHITSQAAETFRDLYERDPTDTDEDLAEIEQLSALFANCFLSPICSSSGPLRGYEEKVPASELVLPLGYTFAQDDSAWEEEESEDRESRPRRGRPRKAHTYEYHKRFSSRQRRRASRDPVACLPWSQYYRLLKELDAQLALETANDEGTDSVDVVSDNDVWDEEASLELDSTEGTDIVAAVDSVLPSTTVPDEPLTGAFSLPPLDTSDSQLPGAVSPSTTASSWRVDVELFLAWLGATSLSLPEHLRSVLLRPRGSLASDSSDEEAN